jgi:hypothetical protein
MFNFLFVDDPKSTRQADVEVVGILKNQYIAIEQEFTIRVRCG